MVKLSETDADLAITRLTGAGELQEPTLNRSSSPDATVNEQWQIESPGAVESIHGQNVLAVSPYRSPSLSRMWKPSFHSRQSDSGLLGSASIANDS